MGVEKFKRKVLTHQHNWPDNRGVVQGLWDYDNTLTAQSILADTWTRLNNNGAGPQSTNEFAYPYSTHAFDTTSNQFDFSNLEIGDTVDIRMTATVVTPSNSQAFKASLFFGIGVFEYEIPMVSETQFKFQGAHNLGAQISVYIGNALTRDNPGEIRIWSDGNATVTVDGWFVRSFALKRF